MNGWSALDRFLQTDPRDVGCAEAMELLHVYAELVAADTSAAERYPGIAAHLRACGPCGEDFDGLLAAIRGAAGFFDGADGAGVLSVTPHDHPGPGAVTRWRADPTPAGFVFEERWEEWYGRDDARRGGRWPHSRAHISPPPHRRTRRCRPGQASPGLPLAVPGTASYPAVTWRPGWRGLC